MSPTFPAAVIRHVIEMHGASRDIGRAELERGDEVYEMRVFGLGTEPWLPGRPPTGREELYWLVRRVPGPGERYAAREYVAAGVLGYWPTDDERGEPYVDSPDSAVLREYQGRGIYKAVLHALRELLGVPMESSTSMTAGSIRVWHHLPGVEVVERRDEPVYRWPAR
jgi:GNAT superfamily N-acetyltransferase